MCDHCDESCPFDKIDMINCAEAAFQIVLQAQTSDLRLTSLKLLNAVMGKGDAKLKLADWKPGKNLSQIHAEQVILTMLQDRVIKEDFVFTPYNTISYIVVGDRDLNRDKFETFYVPKEGKTANASKRKKSSLTANETEAKRAKVQEDIICLSDDNDFA